MYIYFLVKTLNEKHSLLFALIPQFFQLLNSHFSISILGIVAQESVGERESLKERLYNEEEFPMTSFPLYSLTLFLRTSSKFSKVEIPPGF